MLGLYSYRKVSLKNKIAGLIGYSYAGAEEASPCLIQQVYEVLVFCCWFPHRVVHHDHAVINPDTKQYPVEAVHICIRGYNIY